MFSQTYGSILTFILHINDVPCCWAKLYVNGVLDAEDQPVGSLQPNTDPLEIGGRLGESLTYAFVGLMDSIKLFNRALSDAEIAQLAIGRLGGDAILQCNGGSSMVTMTSSHVSCMHGLVGRWACWNACFRHVVSF
jgi:hypothetical protein